LYQVCGINHRYLIAVRKMRNDCVQSSTFSTFFNGLKKGLCTDPESRCSGPPARKAFCIPTSRCLASVTDAQFLEGVEAVFKMGEGNLEAREQCAKMMCDIASKDAHYLELPAFRSKALYLLTELVVDESDDVRQHAIMAISVFADIPSYKEAFIQSSVLPVLFGLVENAPDQAHAYETAQVRRTAAAVLAVLSRTHPYSVRSELQQQQCDVAGWLQRVGGLIDGRTRESAQVVKSFLEDVSIVAGSGSSEESSSVFGAYDASDSSSSHLMACDNESSFSALIR
jgi:hypothetical protein